MGRSSIYFISSSDTKMDKKNNNLLPFEIKDLEPELNAELMKYFTGKLLLLLLLSLLNNLSRYLNYSFTIHPIPNETLV